MKFSFKVLLTIVFVSFLINSCRKPAPPCRSNCATINANGIVIDKLANAGAAGVPVTLNWVKPSGGLFTSLVIAKVNSKADGSFNFTSDIDTSNFSKHYHLLLNVGSSNSYIILGYSGVISATAYYSFDPNVFQAKQFEVYKKANLKIRLHRTLNDYFTTYQISHSNVLEYFFDSDYRVESPQEVIDRNVSELNVETVADVYTKIKTVKTFANGTSVTTLDSVRCTANSTGIYDVTF